MAMQFQDGAHDNLRRTATGGGEVATSYYQSGADAATQNKASYNVNAGASYIKKIEMLI